MKHTVYELEWIIEIIMNSIFFLLERRKKNLAPSVQSSYFAYLLSIRTVLAV